MTAATLDARVKDLAAQLRCLVCQNQSIADSNAPLAMDLRGQLVEQIAAGKTDTQIKHYMTERYGDFILYDPPFSGGNAVLWLGPFVLLAVAIMVAARTIRQHHDAQPLADADREIENGATQARNINPSESGTPS